MAAQAAGTLIPASLYCRRPLFRFRFHPCEENPHHLFHRSGLVPVVQRKASIDIRYSENIQTDHYPKRSFRLFSRFYALHLIPDQLSLPQALPAKLFQPAPAQMLSPKLILVKGHPVRLHLPPLRAEPGTRHFYL